MSEIGYMLFECDEPRAGERHRLRHTIRLEVTSVRLRPGGLVVTATAKGPFDPMRGTASLYAPDGSPAVLRMGTGTIPRVRRGETLTMTQPADLSVDVSVSQA